MQAAEFFLKTNWRNGTFSYYRLEDRVDGFDYPYPAVSPTAAYRSATVLKQRVDIIAGEYNYALSDNATVTSHLSYAKRVGSHCAACHGAPQGDFADDIIDHGYQAFGNIQLELSLADKHTLLVGAETRRINAGNHEDELGTHNTANAASMGHSHNDGLVTAYNKHAFYLQNQWRASNKLSITPGIRVDSKTDPDLFSAQTSPRIEALYKFRNDLRVRGGWNRARHYPDFSTLYQNTWFIGVEDTGLPGLDAFPFAFFTPYPSLAPEQIDSWNLGFDYEFRENWLFKFDSFWSKVEDFHVLLYVPAPDPTGTSSVQWENHPDQARTSGFEAEVRWGLSQALGGFINWSWQTQDERSSALDSTGKTLEFVYAPQNKIGHLFWLQVCHTSSLG